MSKEDYIGIKGLLYILRHELNSWNVILLIPS